MGLASALSLSALAGCSNDSSSSDTETETNVSDDTETSTASSDSDSDTDTDADTESQNSDAEGTDDGAEATSTTDDVFAEYVPTYVPEETVTITIYSQVANYSGEQKGWIADVLLDKFNVVVNIENDSTLLTTMLQTGEFSDIVIWGSESEDYDTAVDSGYLLNWNKDNLLSTYGSYMEENMADALAANAEYNDGTVYGFTGSIALEGSSNSDGLIYTWDTRWDLYEEIGMPDINDLDDYIDMMKAFKEIEPTDDNGNPTYALSMWTSWDGNMVMYVKAFATAYYGYDEWGIGLYDVNTGTVYGALDDSEGAPYYTVLKWMNELYREGLIDPNSASQEYDQYAEKMAAGGAFFSIFKYAGQDVYNTEEHVSENKVMMSLIPNDATPIIYELSTSGTGYDWTISATTEYPELCMEIIDWLSTPEGALTYWYGPRGENWDVDEDGNLYLTDFGYECQQDKRGTEMSETGHEGTYNDGSFQINSNIWATSSLITGDPNGQSFLWNYWDSMQLDASCDAEQSWRDYTGETLAINYLLNCENAVIAPAISTSFSNPSKTSDLYTSWSQVTSVIVDGSWNCIYAESEEEFEELWAKMVADANSYGYQECLEFTEEQAETRYLEEQLLAED